MLICKCALKGTVVSTGQRIDYQDFKMPLLLISVSKIKTLELMSWHLVNINRILKDWLKLRKVKGHELVFKHLFNKNYW